MIRVSDDALLISGTTIDVEMGARFHHNLDLSNLILNASSSSVWMTVRKTIMVAVLLPSRSRFAVPTRHSTGESHHPSGERKPTEVMVGEILDQIFH